jgi:hypothetical protein
MSDPQTGSAPAAPLDSRSLIGRVLDQWMADSSPELIQVAREAALLHHFDIDLLNAAHGVTVDTTEIVAGLERYGLVYPLEDDLYAFHPDARTLMLRSWQIEDLAGYRSTNARLADFWAARAFDGEAVQIEAIYHQLGADEALGLQMLGAAFDANLAARRFGVAERLLQVAQEQAPVLSSATNAWLAYYAAKLQTAINPAGAGEGMLRTLADQTLDPALKAQICMSLGDFLVATQRWEEALTTYRQAEALFVQLNDPLRTARAYDAQGMVYVNLAASLGGLREENEALFDPPYRIWLERLAHAPFLLYRWFSRRFSFLPNLYFGTNYQNWIIIHLLYLAIKAFQQAAARLSSATAENATPSDTYLIDIRIRLADLYDRVGRWSVADHEFAQLSATPAVAADDYRRATLELSQGRAALGRGRLSTARLNLEAAYAVFARYGDQRSIAMLDRLLGNVQVQSDNPDGAVPLYVASIEASQSINDLLGATHTWSLLAYLRERKDLSPSAADQIDGIDAVLSRRAYVARFPGPLLRRFRTLAKYMVVPTAVLIALFIMLPSTTLVVGFFEVLQQALGSYADPISDALRSLWLIFASMCLTYWTYEFFYVVIGGLIVRRLSPAQLAQHPPQYVVTAPAGIAVRIETGQVREVAWSAIARIVSANRAVLRKPTVLFSHLVLVAEDPPLFLDGIISHYQGLHHDIARRLLQVGHAPEMRMLDYSFLWNWGTVVALVLSIFLSVVSFFQWLDPTCRSLQISRLVLDSERFAYVVDGKGDIQVVDVHDDSRPLIVGGYDTAGVVTGLDVIGKRLYAAMGPNGLQIIDVQNPAAPALLSVVHGPALSPHVANGLVYVAAGDSGMRIIDVHNIAIPVEIGHISGNALGVDVDNGYAFVAAGAEGLRVVDVHDPSALHLVGTLDTPGTGADVAISQGYAYVADGDRGLAVVDITQPAALRIVDELDTPGNANDVAIEGNFAFVADGSSGVRIFHIIDPQAPVEVASFDTPGNATRLAVVSGIMFVADEMSGLRIINALNPCDPISESGALPLPGLTTWVAAHRPYPLLLTSWLYQLLLWGVITLPLVGLIRLVVNRNRVRRALEQPLHWPTELPYWIALIFLFASFLLALRGLTR